MSKESVKAESWSRHRALFWIFFSISAVSLGGGLAMLPVMQREFVEKRHWLTEEEMVDTVAVMQSLPGVIAINMAVLLGYRIAGVTGALAATVGVILPPFAVIVVIAATLRRLAGAPAMDHIFLGVRAGVTALILLSAVKLGRQIVKDAFSGIVFAAGFVAMVFVEVNAIWLIVAAALVGLAHAWVAHRHGEARR